MNRLLRLAFRAYQLQSRVTRPVSVGVRLILIKQGRVVLVRHSYQSKWHFPGGGIKRYETPVEAAEREAFEEAGAIVLTRPELLGIYSSFGKGTSDHIFTFVCGEFALSQPSDRWEIAEMGLFALDALPDDISGASLRRLRDHASGAGTQSLIW